MTVIDNQANAYNTNQLVKRYNGEASVVLNTKNVDQVQQAAQNIGQLVRTGVSINQSFVRYLFNDLNSLKPKMLDEATTNASIAAERFAQQSHTRLGGIRSAQQGLFTITDADEEHGNGNSIMKKVRVVTTVAYFLG